MRRVFFLLLFLQNSLFAVSTLTWQGTNSSMNQAANWSPATVPVNNDILIFPPSATYSKNVLNNIAGGALTIGNMTIADTYIFTGGTFVIPSGTQTLTYGASGSNINLGGVTLVGTWQISGVGAAPGNTIQSNISGGGNLDIQGSYLMLQGTNTYTGTTTLGTGSTLQAKSATAFPRGSNVSIASGATLDLNSFSNTIGTLTGIAGSAITLGTATLTVTNSGVVDFPGTISPGAIPHGGGFALDASSSGTLTLSGNNTYSSLTNPGSTIVNGATLKAGSATAFGSYSNLTVAGGATLDLNDFDNTFGTINGTGSINLGSATITCAQGGVFSGANISGTGGLTLTSSTLTLSGVNAYLGATEIQGGSTLIVDDLGSSSSLLFSSGGGILQAAAPFSFANAITLNGNGTVNTNGNAVTLGGTITGGNALTKTGAGVLTLDGANSYMGATNVAGGTLRAGTTSAYGTNSQVTLTNLAVLDLNNQDNTIGSLAGGVGSTVTLGSATLTISNANINNPFYGTISGSGNLALTGGTLSLMKTNSFLGTTTIQGGSTLNTLNLGSTSQLIFSAGGGNVEFGSDTTSTADLVINGPATIGTNTFDVTISGAIGSMAGSAFTKLGLGTLTLTGANSNAAQITIEGGVLNVNAAALGSATAIVFDTFGGTLQAGGDLAITQPITLSSPGTVDTNGHSVTIGGAITAGNPFTKAGAGTLTLTGANNYTGRTTIAGGTLLAGSASYPSGSQLVFSGTGNGIFQANSDFLPIASSVVLMADGTIDTNGHNMNISGVVAGLSANTLNKSGTGILTLSGGNIYTGPTNVNGGVLQAGSTTAFSSGSPLTVATGATLEFQMFANTVGALTNSGSVTSQATISPASFTQNANGASTLEFPMAAPAPCGNILATGAIHLNGQLTVANTGGYMPSPGTEIILFKSTGTGKQLHGTFSLVSPLPFGSLSYDYSENQVMIGSGSCDSTWSSSVAQNWGNTANWNPTCAPGVSGVGDNNDIAHFPNVAASSAIVTLANALGTAAQSVTLHDLEFNASTTSYTIEQFDGTSMIVLDGLGGTSKPKITILAGDHTIDAPIALNKDARFILHAGSLTLGSHTIVSSVGTLNLSEGAEAGTLINHGQMSPAAILFEGNTVNNYGTIHPVGALVISGLNGISNTTTVNNYMTMTSGGNLTIGSASAGPTQVNNGGTMSSSASFTIQSGTVNNNSGGQIFAASANALSITGGSVVNNLGAVFGSSDADLTFSGGALTNFAQVLAKNYIQSGAANLQINVSTVVSYGGLSSSGTTTLDGSLVVNALPDFAMSDGQTVNLITAQDGVFSTFGHVSFQNFPPSAIPSLVYLPGAVQLDIRKALPVTSGGNAHIVFNSIGQHNSFITTKSHQLRNRMPQASGHNLAARQFSENELMAQNEIDHVTSIALINPQVQEKEQQLAERIAEERNVPWNFYIGPIASSGSVKTKGDQIGVGYYSMGGLIGFDYVFSDNDHRRYQAGWGAVVEYRRNFMTERDDWGSSTIDRVHGSLYATAIPKSMPDLAFEGIVGFAYNWDDLHRNAGINKQQTAKGFTNEKIFDVLLGLEYQFSNRSYAGMSKNFCFIPFLTLQYVIDHISAYTEHGAGMYNLRIGSQTPQSLSSVLGSRFDYLIVKPSCTLRVEFDAGWQLEYLNRSTSIGVTAFNVTSVATTARSVAPGRSSLLLGLDLLATFGKGWQLEASGNYQLNTLFYDTFFYLGVGKEF